jgi:hypothetical protein
MDEKILHCATKKSSDLFRCESCQYETSRHSQYERHLLTNKHNIKISNNKPEYKCINCLNVYKHQSSLCKHAKSCNPKNEVAEPVSLPPAAVVGQNDQLIVELLTKNKELMEMLLVQTNKPIVNNQTTNNIQNNNQNNKFNINVYLNETCKDAINFSEFIENIEVSYQDLENNVQLGFVNGIAKIFTDNLKQLELHQRPIHCTDVKREVVYIKDNNVWTKQLNTDKLNYAVNVISYKGIKKLMMWKRENPEYQDVNSDFSNKCIDIQQATMAGYNQHVYNPKVIHVIARETAIRK